LAFAPHYEQATKSDVEESNSTEAGGASLVYGIQSRRGIHMERVVETGGSKAGKWVVYLFG
jgi:hypothetical protein